MDAVAHHLIAIADPATPSHARDDAIEAVLLATRPTWRKWGGHLETDEVLQIARLAIWESAPKYDPSRCKAIGYVSIVVRSRIQSAHKSLTAIRNGGKTHTTSLDVAVGDDNETTYAANVEDRHDYLAELVDREAVEHLLDGICRLLSPFEGRALRLIVRGYTYRQVAEILGTKPKAIDNALRRVHRLALKYPTENELRRGLAHVPLDVEAIVQQQQHEQHHVEPATRHARASYKTGLSGVRGVSRSQGRWRAVAPGHRYLGVYASVAEASAAIEAYLADPNPEPYRPKKISRTSAYRGVSHYADGRWVAKSHGKYIGSATTEVDAAALVAAYEAKHKRPIEPASKGDRKMQKDTQEIIDTKLALYDTIEAQAYLQAQHQQLETKKADLAKKLGELRQAASDAAAK